METRHPTRRKRWSTWLLRVYALFSIALSIYVQFIDLDITYVELLQSTALLLLIPAPLLLMLAMALRERWVFLLLLPAGVCILVFYLGEYFISVPDELLQDQPQIRVMTFNIASLHAPEDIDAILAIIGAANPDVIALQELHEDGGALLYNALRTEYLFQALHYDPARSYAGQGVFSRYPIIEDEYWQFDDLPFSHGHQRVVFIHPDFPFGPLTLYNVHPWPGFAASAGFNFNPNTPEDISHRESVRRIVERAIADPGGVLLVGDFNMTPQFFEYRLVRAYYHDAYIAAGHDMGFTLGHPPLMRIDYVFYSDYFFALDARIANATSPSDHFPVLVTLTTRWWFTLE